jgi:hypothetical protein
VSLEALKQKAQRFDLLNVAVGYAKTPLEKDPDRRVQEDHPGIP